MVNDRKRALVHVALTANNDIEGVAHRRFTDDKLPIIVRLALGNMGDFGDLIVGQVLQDWHAPQEGRSECVNSVEIITCHMLQIEIGSSDGFCESFIFNSSCTFGSNSSRRVLLADRVASFVLRRHTWPQCFAITSGSLNLSPEA